MSYSLEVTVSRAVTSYFTYQTAATLYKFRLSVRQNIFRAPGKILAVLSYPAISSGLALG